jgi:Uma2 family endonuclease
MRIIEPATLVSVEEYLGTAFEGADREYVYGRVLERNAGEIDHADWQSGILTFLRTRYPQFWSAVEVRVQVAPTRFRVPDVCLVTGSRPQGRYVAVPPLVVVEVLSPDDRASDLQEKIEDF